MRSWLSLAGLGGALAALALVPAGTARSPRAEPARYPLHTGITATVFWIGEPVGNGSTEDNSVSAYDDLWQEHYGGFDDYSDRRSAPFFPKFKPLENPFYLDVPYSDFTDAGDPRATRTRVVPWARAETLALAAAARRHQPYSLLKNRWVRIEHATATGIRRCYGQVEDAGPYVYDDARYVFGRHNERPRSRRANSAGMDVSPALRDCLAFAGLNDATNKVSWRFVDAADVPPGPWRRVVTTRQVFWR